MRRGFLPLDNKETNYAIPVRGDIIETYNGEQFSFIEIKQVRWVGKSMKDGKTYNIPFYLDRFKTIPYAKKVAGKDKSMELKTGKTVKLTFGELFSLPQRKETFMFTGDKIKRGKKMLGAVDIASGKMWSIGLECDVVKIDLNKIKKEAKV